MACRVTRGRALNVAENLAVALLYAAQRSTAQWNDYELIITVTRTHQEMR